MSSGDKLSVVRDIRKLLQDIVTQDLKALAVRLSSVEEKLERVHSRMDSFEGKMDRFGRQDGAAFRPPDGSLLFKDVQELKEFRIRMEERQKPGEAAH